MKIRLDNGHEADVIHAVRPDGSVLLTATAGESSHDHTLTLGSVDQPLPDHYTDEHLKADLDAARKFAASMAVSKAQSAGMEGPQRDKIAYGPTDFAIQHTHPNASSDKPSANDVESAKKLKKPIYVTSRTGLWMASPDGKVTQVFKSPTWFTDKKAS
jgi:hypothetical protein